MKTIDQAFLALHDLSLDVSGAITPDRIAGWAQKAMHTLNPGLQTAVWWLEDKRASGAGGPAARTLCFAGSGSGTPLPHAPPRTH